MCQRARGKRCKRERERRERGEEREGWGKRGWEREEKRQVGATMINMTCALRYCGVIRQHRVALLNDSSRCIIIQIIPSDIHRK